MTYREFSTWNEVLSAAAAGEQLWYQAPLDRSPKYVRVVKVFKNGSIRIDPLSRDVDNFTADAGHLSRFRYRVATALSNPTTSFADNPVSGGAVALAALAVAGVAWLFLRPKPAQAAPATTGPVELPSFVPSSTPAPQPVAAAPKLPQTNCGSKVYVTYKFKDQQQLLINVFRRLTTWNVGGTPDSPSNTTTERVWAPSTTNSFFKINYLETAAGPLPFEVELQYAQNSLMQRYLAEAWVETTDGWCLAATSTNYEAWV